MSGLMTEPPQALSTSHLAPSAHPALPSCLPLLDAYRLWILLAITLLGGAVRFACLDRPPLWGDEALTYSRVCGDYRDMLDILTYDGFPPLHYEAYWALGKATRLTPRMMRVIPATAGTLMIPAMYFLAAQIVRRRTALLVALFTCVSAFMMVYSHDAKMYMPAWLFTTLNVACLLWWLRTARRVAWLAWIATGLAMAGFHLSSLSILAIEPVILFTFLATKKRTEKNAGIPAQSSVLSPQSFALLFLSGLLVIAAGPAGYRLGFNRWGERIDEVGFAAGSGVGWVESYNHGRTGPDLALYAATAHLFSWEWPSASIQSAKPGIPPDLLHGFMIVAVILLTLIAIGALRAPGSNVAQDPLDAALADRIARQPEFARWGKGPPPSPNARFWIPLLWLSLWIIVPAYGCYCFSMREFASPLSWIERLGQLLEGHWIYVSIQIALLALVSHFWRTLPRYLAGAMPIAALIYLNVVLLQHWPAKPLDSSQWHAAYWPILTQWWNGLTHPRVVLAVVGLLPVIGWQFCGHTFLDRGKRTLQTLLVAATIFLACGGVYQYAIHHFDQLVRKTTADHHDAPQWEMFVQFAMSDHGVPKRETLIAQLRAESPTASTSAIENQADEMRRSKESRWQRLLEAQKKSSPAMTDDQAIRSVAERVGSEKVVWEKWVSVWIPRYVGMCWPGVAIAACALLLRLPTRPLRYAAVGLLLAVNIAQSAARLYAGSEPPLDRVYADVAAAQPSLHGKPTGSKTRTYLENLAERSIPHPGQLGTVMFTGHYYLAQASGASTDPRQFRNLALPRSGVAAEPWNVLLMSDLSAPAIMADLKKSPEADRLILWERIDAPSKDTTSDQLAPLLGPDWRLAHEQTFHGRMHWTWQDLYTLRRREYVKR